MSSVYSALKVERTSHKKCIFNFVYSAQDNGWRPVGDAIVIYTNPFSEQWEHNNMISLSDKISNTRQAWQADNEEKNALGMISNKGY
jgi:hypothetical protein